MKLSIRKFKRMMLVFLYLVAPASIMPLSACKSNKPVEKDDKHELYKVEGYYNRFPIQIYIDDKFSDYNRDLIKTSLIELDEALEGLKFEYNDEKPSSKQSVYSYIDINFDKDGSLGTAKAYDKKTTLLGFAYPPNNLRGNAESPVATFSSSVTLGGYFMISEDIPRSNALMGLELRWNNYSKFGAYVDTSPFTNDRYWNFWTSYDTFRANIERALKGVTKHETSHALGFSANESTGCNGWKNCHSSDKNSLMYPYVIGGGAMQKNKITSDVVDFFAKKYPKDKEKGD